MSNRTSPPIHKDELATYLNDHLGGSVGALELLSDLVASTEMESQKAMLELLHLEISEDQDVLKAIMKAEGIAESPTKKGLAWLAEKLGTAKLIRKNGKNGGLGSFQALEALYLGITGKLLLWRTLDATLGKRTIVPGVDFEVLGIRADTQRKQVEKLRSAVAMEVLG